MSDFDTYDPYATDDETEALIQMLAQAGYGSYPQMLNVPYTKDLMGGSTDPLRNIKSQETHLKSARSLMGFDPIQSFAGPEFEPYVSQYEGLAQQAMGDPYAEALLADLDAGQGSLALKQQIAAATYDPEVGPEEGKKLSPQQAEAYMSWLDQAAQAQATDNSELMRREQMATEGDPFAELLTPEAEAFDEDAYINKLASRGAFGEEEKRTGLGPTQTQDRRRAGESFYRTEGGGKVGSVLDAITLQSPRNRGANQARRRTMDSGRNAGQRGADAANRVRERNYRALAQNEQQQSYRPSPARERALRAVMAYRMSMGLNPT
jgi:hypothetical protein